MTRGVVAWDCASDAYREHAYRCMALDIARLREALKLARGDLTKAIAEIDRELSFIDPELLMVSPNPNGNSQ